MKKKGFTLIELLVVISIIGVLATVVLNAVGDARTEAKISKAKMEMNQIVKAITIAQGESGDYLMTITGSGCSVCAGGTVAGLDYRNIPDTHSFYVRWALSISNIETATDGLMLGVSNITRDPWGSPYYLDENEGEGGGCGYDRLKTYGPDGVINTGDDFYSARIPHIKCP